MMQDRTAPALSARMTRLPSSGKSLSAFRRALLEWYDRNRRNLPWRETQDPYRIWLSEIMLQQTRVAAVLDHYRMFLERFPNLRALAAASEDAVLAAWSGLGYYRRARMLHRCAQELVKNHAARFPQRAPELENLPGIGRYTAAAIASIAFAEPVAVVDGNVERVLRRLTGVRATVRKAKRGELTKTQTWQLAQALLARRRPGDFNQAMMELGATVCVPGEPRCTQCPIERFCGIGQSQAHGSGAIEQERRRNSRPAAGSAGQIKKEIWCMLQQRNGDVRLVQRPKGDSLMAGMWELPQAAAPPHPRRTLEHWRTFRHSITVTDYTVRVLRNPKQSGTTMPAKGRWVAVSQLSQIPITGLTRKILKAGGII
jgi:A/G-specific adenine glycosylase